MKNRGGSTPEQYALPCWAEELQDLIEYRNMNFALGNIFKACYRMGTKEGADPLYDLNKIIYFAERERNRLMGNEDEQMQLDFTDASFQIGTERITNRSHDLLKCMVCSYVDTTCSKDWRCHKCGGIVDILDGQTS